MKNWGCFISATGPKGGITADTAWSYVEVDKQVHNWFPDVFAYLAKAPQKQPGWSSSQLLHQPKWLVLVCSGNSFSIMKVAESNGSTLFENKGHGKAGIADSALWFGEWTASHSSCGRMFDSYYFFMTRKSIPDEIYDSWNKELLIIGSDSEIESDLFDDFQDSGPPVADDIISISTDSASDLDIKLSSSMFDLALNTVPKDKGKSIKKYEDPITPPYKPSKLFVCLSVCSTKTLCSESGKCSSMFRSPLQSPPAAKKWKNGMLHMLLTFILIGRSLKSHHSPTGLVCISKLSFCLQTLQITTDPQPYSPYRPPNATIFFCTLFWYIFLIYFFGTLLYTFWYTFWYTFYKTFCKTFYSPLGTLW